MFGFLQTIYVIQIFLGGIKVNYKNIWNAWKLGMFLDISPIMLISNQNCVHIPFSVQVKQY